jgi:hypothetical protein
MFSPVKVSWKIRDSSCGFTMLLYFKLSFESFLGTKARNATDVVIHGRAIPHGETVFVGFDELPDLFELKINLFLRSFFAGAWESVSWLSEDVAREQKRSAQHD